MPWNSWIEVADICSHRILVSRIMIGIRAGIMIVRTTIFLLLCYLGYSVHILTLPTSPRVLSKWSRKVEVRLNRLFVVMRRRVAVLLVWSWDGRCNKPWLSVHNGCSLKAPVHNIIMSFNDGYYSLSVSVSNLFTSHCFYTVYIPNYNTSIRKWLLLLELVCLPSAYLSIKITVWCRATLLESYITIK